MLEEPKSTEREFYREMLYEKLKKAQEALSTPILYLEARAAAIIWSIFTRVELFGTGLAEIFTRESARERELGKVVVAAVMDEQGQAELEQQLPLFNEITVVNLTVSPPEAAQALKVSPIRRKLRGFLEVSFNFFPYVDTVYSANHPTNAQACRPAPFAEALSSFLLSLPKFHEFQLNFAKTQGNLRLAGQLEQALRGKLGVLERYGSSQYKEGGSPRVRVLLLERKVDAMSPLVYSYYYGPIARELGMFEDHPEFAAKSALYSQLFRMDIQEASEFLVRLSEEKAKSKKETLEKEGDVHQIKKAITVFCDNTASSREIQLHIEALNTIREFCKRRAVGAALQQTILNNRSQDGQKMSVSRIIDRIIEWASLPLEKYKASEEDYIKMLVLAYMVNSFWFFQRKIINAALEHPRRERILAYCREVEDSYKPLPEKPQGEDRYDLYRHQPALLNEVTAWIGKEKELQSVAINPSSANRSTVYVIAVDGVLGFNEACFLLRHLREKEPQLEVRVFCQRLVTTKQYLGELLGP